MKLLLITIIITFLSNCLYSIHHLNESDVAFPQKLESMKKIESEVFQHVILGFAFDTNYVEEAINKLINQCPDGTVQSIAVRYSTDLGFLSWKNRIQLKGYCVK